MIQRIGPRHRHALPACARRGSGGPVFLFQDSVSCVSYRREAERGATLPKAIELARRALYRQGP